MVSNLSVSHRRVWNDDSFRTQLPVKCPRLSRVNSLHHLFIISGNRDAEMDLADPDVISIAFEFGKVMENERASIHL
jgi:hypothetical protein